MVIFCVPDHDLGELSLWLADFTGGPVVTLSLSATVSTILKCELVLVPVDWLRLNDSDKIVIVAEFLDGREVSVLLAVLEWQVRIRVSVAEFGWKLILQNMSEDT